MSLASFVEQIVRMSTSAYRAGRGRRLHRNNPEFWQTLPQRVLEEAPCTFVLSTGRCGTQLLTKVLRRCGNVDVNHHTELTSELQYASRVAYENGELSDPAFELAALCSRFEPIQTSFLQDRIFAETNNRITLLAPALRRVFKNARFIHLVRNPVGFVRSGLNAGFYSGGYYDTGRLTPKDALVRPRWENYSRLKKIAWLWNETNLFIENFKSSVPSDRWLTVHSEKLFKQPDVVREVVDFVGGRPLRAKTLERLAARKVNAGAQGGLPSSLNDWPVEDQAEMLDSCPLAQRYGYIMELPTLRHSA